MKILVVCQYYYPEPFRIADICEMLAYRGHNVTVLTGLPNYPEGKVHHEYCKNKKRNETINGVKVLRTFEIGRGKSHFKLFLSYLSFTISASLKALFLKNEYDVVFVNQLSPVLMAIPAIIYKKKNKKKILLYCLDLWPESLAIGGIKKGSLIYNLFLVVSKMIYKSVDKIAVASSMFKEYFKNTLDISPDNIEHIPQYAEDLFLVNEVKNTNKNEINRNFNFMFAGNVGEFQSVETIISAARELQDRNNYIFHIIGDGAKLEECKRIANKFGLSNVIFYGKRPVEEMPGFYEMVDAMLITLINSKNISYTLPGKIQSYMAAGKPIIGAINGETRNVIEKAECGICCEAENYIGLAQLIVQFVNSNKKEQMSYNARRYYADNYSKNIFFEQLEKELKNLM
mgnify:CR=1 FL=1